MFLFSSAVFLFFLIFFYNGWVFENKVSSIRTPILTQGGDLNARKPTACILNET